MTNAPTTEEFLSQVGTDDEEEETYAPDPMDSIAESLRRLVTVAEGQGTEEAASEQLREDLDDLESRYVAMDELVEGIVAIVKPSTSKLANSVREAVDRWRGVPVEPEPAEMGAQRPTNDAPVEEWREFARSRGYQGPDVDKANRSQIRTMLGIAQPETDPAP